VAVALGGAVVGAFVDPGADLRGGLGFDELLGDPLEARADRVGHLPAAERVEQAGKVRIAMVTGVISLS
jgi:hypothetical protein